LARALHDRAELRRVQGSRITDHNTPQTVAAWANSGGSSLTVSSRPRRWM